MASENVIRGTKESDMRVLVEKTVPEPQGPRRRARKVTINLAESPLTWLHARGRISDRQHAAGEALRRDFERAALAPRVTQVWDAPPAGRIPRGAPDPAASTHAQIAARRRFHDAIAAAGPGLADILWRVVCAGEAMPEAERGLGWPSRSGRLVLTLALDRVADYHRLA
jgi:Domain of unknown function (DUF6456)